MEITISGKDKKLLKLVENLAKALGLSIKKNNKETLSRKVDSTKLYDLMEEMAASGGVESIKDPVAWQESIREEKPLYGRE